MNYQENYNYWLQHKNERIELDDLERIQHGLRVNLGEVIGKDSRKSSEIRHVIYQNKYRLRELNLIFRGTQWWGI